LGLTVSARHVPLDEPIDLLNVAFENPRKIQLQVEGNVGGFSKKKKRERDREIASATNNKTPSSHNAPYLVPDRVSGLQEVEELRRLCPGRLWNFVINFYSCCLPGWLIQMPRLR
jgi:hypothetical protein